MQENNAGEQTGKISHNRICLLNVQHPLQIGKKYSTAGDEGIGNLELVIGLCPWSVFYWMSIV